MTEEIGQMDDGLSKGLAQMAEPKVSENSSCQRELQMIGGNRWERCRRINIRIDAHVTIEITLRTIF